MIRWLAKSHAVTPKCFELTILRPTASGAARKHGTQVGKELAIPRQPTRCCGTPIVLGGVIWMKFEIIK